MSEELKLSGDKEVSTRKINLLFGILGCIFLASLCVSLFLHNYMATVEVMFGCFVCFMGMTCWTYDCYRDFTIKRKAELKELLKK